MKRNLVLFAVLFYSGVCFGQTTATIDKLDDAYQECLDKGEHMLACSRSYYFKIDSMLNVVYKKIQLKSDSTSWARLKTEQRGWIAKRDRYFKTVNSSPGKSLMGGEDGEMITIDKKAQFVRDRLVELIKKL